MDIKKNNIIYIAVAVLIIVILIFVYFKYVPKEVTEEGETITSCGEGTVIYKNSNLCWERGTVLKDAANWQNAKDYCDNLILGGKEDWKLPTADELKTIVDNSYEPAINPQYFTNAEAAHYWTSSEYRPGMHFYIHFQLGYQGFAFDYSKDYAVRCVRLNSIF